MRRTAFLVVVALGVVVVPGEAQQRGRQPTIEIRGQVPTPQVVTVRPREVPQYTRQVLVPLFYDRTFWPSILPAYALIPMRQLAGMTPVDTAPQAMVTIGVPSISLPPTRPAQPTGPATGTPATGATGPSADSAAAAIRAATRQAELDAIRAELERRRQRLDSLSREVQQMGRPRQGRGQSTPADTTRQTPSSPDGGSPR